MSSHMLRFSSLALAVFAAIASSAKADVSFTSQPGLEGLGAYSGTLAFAATSDTQATLTLSLTNTSPVSNGGYLTGFAFNVPSTITGVTGYTPSITDFEQITSVSTPPFGSYDFGAAIGGDWTGGGKPQDGIAVGATASFTFTVSGTGLTSLTASDIADSSPWLAARFRGFINGGSDKVKVIGGSILNPGGDGGSGGPGGGDSGGGGPGPNPVPAPAGLVLGLIALAGLTARRVAIR